MWYIFPQISGLGHSATAQIYAILTLDEAKAYLNHPVLGDRLRECTRLVMSVNFHSSMTLFAHAAGADQLFLDSKTIERLPAAITFPRDGGR